MIDPTAVRLVLRSRLKALDDSVQQYMRWENVSADPPDPDTVYVEEELVPFATLPVTLGHGVDRMTGDYMLKVTGPRGRGTEALERIALQVVQLYRAGDSLIGDASVRVDRAEIRGGHHKDETRYVIPVAVTFRAEANRYEGVQ